jgi:hypothetical protein
VEGEIAEDSRARASLLEVLSLAGKRSSLLDDSDMLCNHVRGSASGIVCKGNDQTLTKFKAQVRPSLYYTKVLV